MRPSLVLFFLAGCAAAQTYRVSTVAGGHIPVGAPATSIGVFGPHAIAIDTAGRLYVVPAANQVYVVSNGAIEQVFGTGTQGYAGDGALASAAQFAQPSGVKADSAGNLYIADANNHAIRKVAAQ